MLKINKFAHEPAELSAWKALENEDWQPTYDGLGGEPNRLLRLALVSEQGGVCCYCNRLIAGPAGAFEQGTFHIEHFRPQHPFTALELDYQNLHASCNDEGKKRRHCGAAKADWFDEELTLSPLTDDSQRFRYGEDGSIFGVNDPAVETTIKKLALDHPRLVEERQAQIAGKLDAGFIVAATDDELITMYRAHQQQVSGLHEPFAMAIMQRIADLLPVSVRETL